MPKVYRRKLSTVEIVPNSLNMDTNLNIMKQKAVDAEVAFYHIDLGHLVQQYVRWQHLLPRVRPFYAVKCHDDATVISVLGKLGVGFDCASKREIKLVCETLKYSSIEASKNIIYANPYKFKKGIMVANRNGVKLATFDSESELIKLSQEWPSVQLVLRLSTPRLYDASDVLGNKYGTDPHEISTLLHRAKQLSMNVVGLSFHVGSGCRELEAFPETVLYCSKVIALAHTIGFYPKLLDIGGGFPGWSSIDNDLDTRIQFHEMCSKLNSVLDAYFPVEENYQIIAEPGRYFVYGAYTLATQIIGKRSITLPSDNTEHATSEFDQDSTTSDLGNTDGLSSSCISDNRSSEDSWDLECCTRTCEIDINKKHPEQNAVQSYRYIMNEGVYNSFTNVVLSNEQFFPYRIIDREGQIHEIDYQGFLYKSALFGPTCDGLDCVIKDGNLPSLEVGDWLVWPNMGAYTVSTSCRFNGIPLPKKHYFLSQSDLVNLNMLCNSELFDDQHQRTSDEEISMDSNRMTT